MEVRDQREHLDCSRLAMLSPGTCFIYPTNNQYPKCDVIWMKTDAKENGMIAVVCIDDGAIYHEDPDIKVVPMNVHAVIVDGK